MPSVYAVTRQNVVLAHDRTAKVIPMEYSIIDRHVGLSYRHAMSLRDNLAMNAPTPDASFIPFMSWAYPEKVLTASDIFGEGGISPDTIYMNFYDPLNRVWDPQADVLITIMQAVDEQNVLYDRFKELSDKWDAEYRFEKIIQWPYFYADQVISRM